ncbi:hypothetical protein [Rhizobium rhizogenes]|uniref:hypothetical protein n=1 Tax=Rhizobium rhizogenes TaxID=359 RepID=UPI00157249E8|nr:hypothetical protein [Rhizobium rhizogenes]NTF67974.1 hypothetical protein [Rhizobium rhizogenes]
MAPKLTMKTTLTPSEEVVQDANRVVHVSDARGRQIGIRKMHMSVRRRVLKALSDEMSRKLHYLGLVMLAACVVEIDGDPIALPTTELQFDALIDRLDDDGFEAVGNGMREHFGVAQNMDEIAAAAGE